MSRIEEWRKAEGYACLFPTLAKVKGIIFTCVSIMQLISIEIFPSVIIHHNFYSRYRTKEEISS